MTYVAAIAALALCLPARAAEGGGVGVIDVQLAVDSIDEGKAAQAQLKKEFEARQKTISAAEDEIRKMGADFQKQQAVMNEETRTKRQEEINQKIRDLQNTYVTLQKELQERERVMTQPIREKMQALVREIAAGEGLAVVLDANAVIYAAPTVDLTNELVRKYNQRHKAGEAKPAADAKKPAAAAPAADAKKPAAAAKAEPSKTGK
jgi:outer membrane protein